MDKAILIIALLGFVGRLVYAARAIRNWIVVTVLTLLAAAVYGLPLLGGFSVARLAVRFSAAFDFAAVMAFCVVMCAIGYGVPALLAYAEQRSRSWRSAGFFVGLLITILAADLAWTIGGLSLISWVVTPATSLAGGVILYLVFHARIFETENEPEPAQRRRSG